MYVSDMAKDTTFNLRLSAEDRERLDALAAKHEMTGAQVIRMLIKKEADLRFVGHDEDEAFERATKAWFRRCRSLGHVVAQPSKQDSGWVSESVYALRNVNGTLAHYDVSGATCRWVAPSAEVDS